MNPLVRHLMQTDVKSVQLTDTLSDVQHLFDDHGFHHVPVLDGERLVGILSALDVARTSLQAYLGDEETIEAHLDTFDVAHVMTPEPETLAPDDTVHDAAEKLGDGTFHALPVVDNGVLVGMITSTDLVRWLYTQR